MVAVTLAVLRAMGRLWWCDEGDYALITWDSGGPHNSQHLFDPYSLTHFEHGVIFFWVLRAAWKSARPEQRFRAALAIECLWEVVENSSWLIERYRANTIAVGYYGDSIANSTFDILACVAGYFAVANLSLGWALGLLAGIELFLLMTIRDNLTLNVLMLLGPIESIQRWQNGG